MPSYDVHQHLWPEELIAALSRRTEPPRIRGGVLDVPGEGSFDVDLDLHRLDRRLELLDRDGTDVGVVSLQPTLGIDALPEDEAAELLAAYHEGVRDLVAASGGRLKAFAASACLEGFAGACVPAGLVTAGSEELDALGRSLQAAGQALFVHPGPARIGGRDPAWWPAVVDYTAQMQAAYLAWVGRRGEDGGGARPAAIFAILAGGGPIQIERLQSRGVSDRLALDPSIYLDVASYGRRALELCLSTFGTRQLVFGSDRPVVDAAPTLRALRSFGDAVTDVVRIENPTVLLG